MTAPTEKPATIDRRRTRDPLVPAPGYPIQFLKPVEGVKVLRSEALERHLAEQARKADDAERLN